MNLKQQVPLGLTAHRHGPNAETPSRKVLWFAVPVMWLFTAFMAFIFNDYGWPLIGVEFIVTSAACSCGLLLTLIDPRRFWWGMRLVTFIIFALYFYYLVDECLLLHKPMHLDQPGVASPFNSLLGFLFFGMPSLVYTLWGSTSGKLGQPQPRRLTRLDLFTALLVRVARWLFLGLIGVVAVAALLRLR